MKKIYLIIMLLVINSSAFTHVAIDFPTSGEQFKQGEFLTIRWYVAVAHQIVDWDIYYSLDGTDGPWIDIVVDYPKNDTTTGSFHEYTWTVPEISSSQFRIRVVQDNIVYDWDAVSLFDMVVLNEDCCDGTRGNTTEGDTGLPDLADLVAFASWAFQSGTAPYCSLEMNVDGSNDEASTISDIVYFVRYLYLSGPAPANCP